MCIRDRYIRDVNNNYQSAKVNPNEVIASNYYTEISFNFSQIVGVDLTRIKEIQIDINGGHLYKGTFFLDDFKIGNVAAKSATLTNIPNQGTFLNAGQSTINLRGITDGTSGTNAISISATSSNTALIPNPTIVYSSPNTSGQLRFTPVANATGTATISVNVTAPNTNATKVVNFEVAVEGNLAPKITQVEDQIAKVAESTTINLAGINDGNPNAKQTISVSASSSNTGIIPNPSVSYTSDNENGSITFTPSSAGQVNVSITVSDNAGTAGGGLDQRVMTFRVTSYALLNGVPAFNAISNEFLLKNTGQRTINITGLDDGDASASQNLAISATSSNTTLVSNLTVNYTQGQSTATLTYTPVSNAVGTSTITVNVTDNGANANNNGNQTTSKTFDIQVREIPITGFADEFNDGVVGAGWGTGEGAHDVTESGGIMQILVDKSRTNNVWAGAWYGIPNELDLTQYPYMSITMRVSNAPKEMLIFLWDAFDKYNTGGTVSKTVSGGFVEYYFDFSGKNKDGSGNIVDFSRIKALLFNFEPGRMYTGSFYFEDIRIGSQARRDPASIVPRVSFNPIGDVTPTRNAGVQNVVISALTNGSGGTTGISLNASSSNTSLVSNPSLTSVGTDGRATLSFTPVAGQTGQARIYVSAAYPGAVTKHDTLSVDVVDLAANVVSNVAVSVNTASTHQSIDGFGGFMYWDTDIELAVNSTNDMGLSMVRFGMFDEGFEAVNDNSNPNIINHDAFNYSAINFELIRQLSQRTSVQKFILTMWSAPDWMKLNKHSSSPNGYMQDNRVMPEYYEEYAEHMVAIIKAIKARTGVELYAISLQNEPQFNQFYPSALVNPQEMRDMIKIVGPRMEAEGLSTKIYAAEVLPAQGGLKDYLDAVYNDPAANPYQQIAALHNYDTDGINVGGAGAAQWADYYGWASRTPYPKVTWMTETSGHPNTWNGSVDLMANIYNALKFGKISAWVYWSIFVGEGSAEFGLVIDKLPSIKYFVSKNYYKYVRPGAVMVDATSPDADVLSLAFKHTAENTFTSILINKSSVAKVIQLTGPGIPITLAAYTTSASKSFEQSAVSNGLVILPPSSIVTVYGSTSGTVDNQVPSVPANLASPSRTSTSVDLTWSASTDNVGVTAYEVFRGGTLVGTTSNANYSVGSLSANTAYSFTVNAKDAAGNTSAASSVLSVTTNAATTGGPVGYTFCSNEGQNCILTGTQDIAYGADGSFSYLTNQAGSVGCNNGTFGDPISGVSKSCYVKASSTGNCTVDGRLTREVWTGIAGTAISNLTSSTNYPNTPNSTSQVTLFEAPVDISDNYGQRISGYVCTPQSGNYTFWISGDDNSELWLSTDANSVNKTRIAYVPGWSNSREWTKSSEQQSASIALVAGQRYYIEALMKEGGGGDNLAVGWQLPDATLERPIPATRIASFTAVAGTGLTGAYYDNQDFTGALLSRIDATVDFDWGNSSPATSMGSDQFSVRWTGEVEAPVSGSYTFSTTSDDGVRLSINNVQVVNNWTLHGPTTDNGTAMSLSAGQKYNVNMEFFEASGGAVARLLWAYPGQTQQVVPQSRLFPTTGARLGVDEKASDFEMYPNPANELVNIRLSNQFEGIVVVSIADVRGVAVATEQFNHSESEVHTISTSSFASGVYIVSVRSNNLSKIVRLIIQ